MQDSFPFRTQSRNVVLNIGLVSEQGIKYQQRMFVITDVNIIASADGDFVLPRGLH